MEIENLFRYTALAVGLKPSASQGEARLRGLYRIISSKTISPRLWNAKPACAGQTGLFLQGPYATAPRVLHRGAPLPEDEGILERVGFSGSLCILYLVFGVRTPKFPLLPLWEKGVGGMRGKSARKCRKPRISHRNSTLERDGQNRRRAVNVEVSYVQGFSVVKR